MKYLWKIALCCLASTIIGPTGHAEEITPPSCQLGRCQWTSHELFEHIVGFKSEPMNVMMEQLTPHNPELWEAYTDTIGNLLLANLYLGRDNEALIQGTYDLRFHPEMTFACVYSMTQVAPFSSFDNEASILELFCLANGMNCAVCENTSGYDAMMKAIAEYITVLYQQGLIPEPTTFDHAYLPPIRIIRLLDKTSLPFSCPDTYSIFATKACEQTVWCSKEDIVAIEANHQLPGDGSNLVDSLTRYLSNSNSDEGSEERFLTPTVEKNGEDVNAYSIQTDEDKEAVILPYRGEEIEGMTLPEKVIVPVEVETEEVLTTETLDEELLEKAIKAHSLLLLELELAEATLDSEEHSL